MRPLIITTVLAFMLSGCGSSGDTTSMTNDAAAQLAEIERTVTTVAASGELNTIADLSISGMSCEMMCGGAIKKKLASLPGVISTEIAYDADQEDDHAIVTYDESKVNDAQLATAIGELHDGQYKVKRIAVERHVPNASSNVDPSKKGSGQTGDVNASIPLGALVPGVIEILSQIVRF